MKKLTIRKARAALTHLDKLLDREGEITLTRRGKPIARVLPFGGKRTMPSHRDLRSAMPRLRRPSQRLIRDDRDR